MNDTVTCRLSDQPFLEGLSQEYLDLLESCSETKIFAQGTYLLNYQQNAEDFFLLTKGQVVLLNHVPMGGIQVLETITAPNAVGWSWITPPARWHYSVKAVQETHCFVIHTPTLLEKMASDSTFAAQMYSRFIHIVVDRLQATRLQSMDIYSNPSKGGSL